MQWRHAQVRCVPLIKNNCVIYVCILILDSVGGTVMTDSVSVCGQVRQGRRISFDADRWFAQYLSNPNPSVGATEVGDSESTPRLTTPRKEVVCSLWRCAESAPSDNKKQDHGTQDSGDSGGAVGRQKPGGDISFANTAQFLLLSLESVHALTQVLCVNCLVEPVSLA